MSGWLTALSWIGNLLILVGMYKVGEKCRTAFLWSIAGESCWIVVAAGRDLWSLAFICAVFCLVSVFNYRKWGHDS
jgi:hypothetical protein